LGFPARHVRAVFLKGALQMNNDFPPHAVQGRRPEEIHGGNFSTLIVHDDDELEAALAGGWHKTTPEAVEAAKPALTGGQTQASGSTGGDNTPPTRAELEQKARELNIEFAPNIGDKKLAERIEAALAGGNKE
jgi:hypothetical protein